MSLSQSDFIKAVFDAELDTPEGLCNPEGTPATKRFSVYRNNVAASLTEALEVTFPTVQKLVGEAFFKAMAGVFLRQHPPDSPLLMQYGTKMPDFLARFEPVIHLGYLPDVARIELALTQSYHGADVTAIEIEILQNIAPDALLLAKIQLAPSVHLIRSQWPAASLYHVNNNPDAPDPAMQPEDALITRAEFDPIVTTLPSGAGAFIQALMQAKTMGQAVKIATIDSAGFDLGQILGLLLSTGAITGITERKQNEQIDNIT